MRKSWKVFIACFIGAGLGALVALEMHQMFWWIGLIVGGIVGYLSYDFRAVLHAIPRAYRAVRGWKPRVDKLYLKESISAAFIFFLLFINALIAFTIIIIILHCFGLDDKNFILNIGIIGSTGCIMFTSSSIYICISSLKDRSTEWTEKKIKQAIDSIEGDKKLIYHFNPFRVFFYYTPLGIWWIAKRTPSAIRLGVIGTGHGIATFAQFIVRFCWQVFIRIHSEARLLCGIDAMIGAAVGFFAGSVIIGAIAGGLFGVLNYAVITNMWLVRKGYITIK